MPTYEVRRRTVQQTATVTAANETEARTLARDAFQQDAAIAALAADIRRVPHLEPYDRLRDERDLLQRRLEAMEAANERLEAERQQAIDALRFYADPASYENATPRTVRPVITDQGAVARSALLSLGEQP